MPLRICRGIKAEGQKILLFAIEGVTKGDILHIADVVVWLRLTQLGRAIRVCRKLGASKAILAGRVRHKRIFSLKHWHFDFTTLRLWLSLSDKRADSLLRAIALMFEKKGIEIMDSTLYLQDCIPSKGVLTKAAPEKKQWADIEFGKKMAQGLGAFDIGQTVVVKNQAVVAVEAMEGTDSCIERAGLIAGSGCIVVKMAKPQQDLRFDVPVIGCTTIDKMAQAKIGILAIEAGKTVILDDDVISKANGLGICIVAI